ncbi:adenosylcobinamide-phosphate synthase CbiB [Vibrio syngnathi]|uniref:Cobalamin biosynthesis protein CobD n=1 Tax=Vibrio syngnathi TaxID=3034029 RepID=A0AA34TLR5_9VIBR|nr:adenosylcobinamide-phosphate synthase CbiB [Vibrio syngnathi]ARP37236.1 cobalamin biosynthesis protein [Vibrio syngnathi]
MMIFFDVNFGYSSLVISLMMICALLLDHLLGEPKRFHPLIGFGNMVQGIEKVLNKRSKLSGLIAWLIATLPLFALSFWLQDVFLSGNTTFGFWLFNIVILYLAVGQRSLLEHAQWIHQPLHEGDLELAREKVGWIVSRNTETMDQRQITSSTIESVLENGNDAIFGTLFWFALLGAPGALLFRLVNTLDAMWGYKNERWLEFGYVAAKVDDVMGWAPARLTALSYSLLGNTKLALKCWKEQAKHCSSPNGGPVMTSGAGALKIIIGGDTYYHGKLVKKPPMGEGTIATLDDIPRSISLVRKTSVLWVAVMLTLSLSALYLF